MAMDAEKRVFSEQEVAEIIRRAAELQEGSKESAADYRLGITREELERAAIEVGVSPQFLQQAIRERLSGSQPNRRGLQLAPEEERVVEGELDPENFDVVFESVPMRHSRRFPVTQVGRSLSGQARTGSGIATVNIHSRNGRTRVRVKPFLFLEALGTFYPAFLASMIGGPLIAQAGGSLLAAGSAVGAWLLATAGFLKWTGVSRRNASKLADHIEAAIAEEVRAQQESVQAKDRLAPLDAPSATDEAVSQGDKE